MDKEVLSKIKKVLFMDAKDIVKIRKVQISFLVIAGISIIALVYSAFFAPTALNKLVASKLYKSPANQAFNDQNFYNCVIDNYNEDKSDLDKVPYTTNLTDSQLKTITELWCVGKINPNQEKEDSEKISNTSGLEKITDLKELHLSYNRISNIDVSHNSELVEINLNNNKLENIDVSKNSENLVYLYLSENQLTNIDVTKNIHLGIFEASNNNLTNIDLTKNTNLWALSLKNNNLSTIDTSKTRLQAINLSNNNFNTIDVSKNTSLESLTMNYNPLTSIDISKNTELYDLHLDRTGIKYVDFSHNDIRQLNMKGNSLTNQDFVNLNLHLETNLGYLDLSDNNLSKISLTKNLKLARLYLNNNQFQYIDLSANTKLSELKISDNQLQDIDLSKNTALRDFDLSNNSLSELDLSKNTKLDIIGGTKLTGNNFTQTFIAKKKTNITIPSKPTMIQLPEKTFYINPPHDIGIALTSQNVMKFSNPGLYEENIYYQIREYDDDSSSYWSKVLAIKYIFDIYGIDSDDYRIDEENNNIYVGSDTNDEVLSKLLEDNSEYVGRLYIDNDKLKLRKTIHGDEILEEYSIIRYSSTKYDLNNKFILVKNEFNLDDIQVQNCTKEVIQDEENNKYKLIIHYGSEDKEWDIVSYKSTKYDLSKDYINVGLEEFNLDDIEIENCTKEIAGNKLLIKYGDEIKDYIIVGYKSSEYDLTKDYIYLGNRELNLNNIEVSGFNKEVKNNKLVLTYSDIEKEFDLLTLTSDKYFISKTGIYYGEDPVSVEEFKNNIDTDLEIKVFRNDIEVTTGNVSYGDVVKVYSPTYGEVHSYTLVEEYLDVSKLDIDNNVIEKVKVGDSFKDIKDKIDTTGTIKLIDKDNNEVEDTSERNLKTGDTIRIELSNEVEEYKVSISGDVNGSGKIDVGDLSKVLTDVMDVEKIEGDCYQKAADYNQDGRLGVGDLSKLLTKLMGGESNG